MTPPSFMSARAWPGIRPWALSVLTSVAVFELLSAFAWTGRRGSLPDLTTALVTVPVAAFLVLFAAAALWSLLARAPFAGGLALAARLLPLAWIFPLFDLLRSLGRGFVSSELAVDGYGYLLSLVTGGLLPLDSGLTVGMRLGMFAGAVTVGLVVWHLTRSAWKTGAAALAMSAVFTKLVYFASALGLWWRISHGLGWAAGESDIGRSVLLAVTNGYWWSNVYDRFPTAVDAQAAIALRLSMAGILVLALGLVLALVFIWQVHAWRRIARHVYLSWTMFDLALYGLGGALVAFLFSRQSVPFRFDLAAALLFLFLLCALRLLGALERSLSRLTQDEREGRYQPVAAGDLAPDQAKDAILASRICVLATSWVLGWPVFAAILVFLAASYLTRERSWSGWTWAAPVFRSIGAASLALAGSFFVLQTNKLGLAAFFISGLAAAHRLVSEFVWIPWKKRV